MSRRTQSILIVAVAGAALLLLAWLLRGAPAEDSVPLPVGATPAPPASPRDAKGPAAAATSPQRARPPAPSAAQSDSTRVASTDGGPRASGNPAMFGKVVGLVQSFALGEALAKNAADADRYVDKLCEEHQKLSDKPPLKTLPHRDRDAAVFMAPLADYEKPLDQPPGKLHLPDELRQRIGSYGAEWPARIDPRDAAGLDFSWLTALQQFDHWSVLAAGRLRDLPPGNAMRDPIPNYASLMAWAKLRLALSIRSGDALAASAEVRHLADLIRSQQYLIGEMVGLALYRFDAQARAAAVAAGASVDGWPQADPAQLDRYRATAFSSLYFTYPGVNPETVKKAVACTPAPCSALLEGAAASKSFGHYGATDNLPLIHELSRNLGCDEALLSRTAESQEIPVGDALESLSEEMADRIPKLLGVLPH